MEEKYQEGDHLLIDDTSIANVTLLDNGTAIHPTPVIMNEHTDSVNDITKL